MGRWRRMRRAGVDVAVAAAWAAVMAGVVGCSGGAVADDRRAGGADGPQGARNLLRQAAGRLAAAGTSRASTSMAMAAGGTRIVIRGEGVYDYRRQRGELLVTLPEEPAGRALRRPITELLTPGAVFLKNRGEGVPLDKWVRLDAGDSADGNLVTGGATDPLAAAELLRGTRRAEYRGTVDFAGTQVRRYEGVAHLGDAAVRAGAGWREGLRAAAKGFASAEVPFDVYLDREGRIRKVRQEFSFLNEARRTVVVTSTMTLYDFGAAVDVRLPAAGDIFAGRIASR
ncbi:hypothetical protein [Streptomyces abyssomicinicus]|uniref:hypothetical protein n=1 Tax=Streptomyces abyssomicinicus TaxID=574929 RepID=UPI0012502253|nr:hypothetical protein [Streptomyces abyssomicinicus]